MSSGPVHDFERLWDSASSPPDVFDFLKANRLSESDQIGVILHDQQQRWKRGSPLAIEEYVARLAELESQSDCQFQLAVGEFLARRSSGDAPNIDEFASRFPDLSDELRKRLPKLAGDASDLDLTMTTQALRPRDSADDPIQRYKLISIVGKGAFGQVYLGFDQELHREVAVKVPSIDRFHSTAAAESYLTEARLVAALDHPHIVPVYDVGRLENGSVYIVSKFIEGSTLSARLKEGPVEFEETVRIVCEIADALACAHRRRLVHRDVKPGNILLNQQATPYLADFGLAIREEDFANDDTIAGTPSYMSPEQARGEGHRLDGRSDIFSLGVVLYEMLAGRKPFRGSTVNELLHQIISVEPRPPEDHNAAIPAELSRICSRALSKRASERYQTAVELAEDLNSWRDGSHEHTGKPRVIPKGLRAFDADDADFFLDLLPGPRGRDGLPESLNFWRKKIDETDPDETFSVGIIYGPSGCGKSSLVKAGLLPRVSADVTTVYIEATPADTENRLLRALRKKLPELSHDLNLTETISHLRRHSTGKVVVVIDQFEQWLHAHEVKTDDELVGALRQSDGGNFQSLVLVRDDFAMAAARFMDCIEIPLAQGDNFATVDLYDVEHARKVLVLFGRAFGRLADAPAQPTDEQLAFVQSAVDGLAESGKVVAVQLALFAEMVKSKDWVPATLEDVGGPAGIGVSFLEETFNSRSANPKHRMHQQAACKVLNALLPEGGSDIKGHMRSHVQLMEVCGYEGRSSQFNELLRILDGELRLIAPTDPEAQSQSGSSPENRFYQLTHDYLVPSLRSWLLRRQRGTRRGRVQLRLQELESIWSTRRESRHLPGLIDWLRISIWSRGREQSPPQRQMMRAANRHFGLRLATVVVLLILAAWIGGGLRQNAQAAALVQALSSAHTSQVPEILAGLQSYKSRSRPLLWRVREESTNGRGRLHATLALIDADEPSRDELLHELPALLLRTSHAELEVHCQVLRPHRAALAPLLWKYVAQVENKDERRLAAAHVLAQFDPPANEPSRGRWKRVAEFVARRLVDHSLTQPRDYAVLANAFQPVGAELAEPLGTIFGHADPRRRSIATSLLIELAGSNTKHLATLVAAADIEQFNRLVRKLQRQPEAAIGILRQEVDAAPASGARRHSVAELERKAKAASALMRLGHSEPVWELFRHSADPTARTLLIHSLAAVDVPAAVVLDRLNLDQRTDVLRALLQTLGEYQRQDFSDAEFQRLSEFSRQAAYHADSGVRASAEWMMRRLRIPPGGPTGSVPRKYSPAKQWFINGQGQRMVVVDARQWNGAHRMFAMADREVTVEQFRRYAPGYQPNRGNSPTDDCPANIVSWYAAVGYCNWLTMTEGLGDQALCYVSDGSGRLRPQPNLEQRAGYRLPTHAEWSCACVAGSGTAHCFGRAATMFDHYAWNNNNSEMRLWPGGLLKPNEFGLFDMHGNAMEWCNDLRGQNTRELRGGSSKFSFDGAAVGNVDAYLPQTTFYSIGFRPVKTLFPDDTP